MNEFQNPAGSAPPPPPAAPVFAAPPVSPAPTVIVERKSAGLAGFLSIFPGIGHVYLGLYQRAFIIGGAFVLLCAMASHGHGGEFFGPLIAFIWFFGIIDAVRQAKAINRGQVAESNFAGAGGVAAVKVPSGAGALAWGVILIGLGALWLANRYLDLDAFWDIIDSWGGPVAIILIGVILIMGHIMKRRREHDAGVGMPPRSQ